MHASLYGPLAACTGPQHPQLGHEQQQRGVQVQLPEGSPQQVSFWLAANMVLPSAARQKLLEAPHATGRLRMLVSLLTTRSQLACRTCNTVVRK